MSKQIPVTDPNGRVVGYKETQKEPQMKTKPAVKAAKTVAVKAKPQPKKEVVEKKTYKVTFMGLNHDNVYTREKDDLMTDDATQIKAALDRWLKGDGVAQFNLFRRK